MSGILYGVGVGPGDPKLMTYLAVETIEKCPVIAVPSEEKNRAAGYRIALHMVKGLDRKECLKLPIPMTKDREILEQSYEEAAGQIIRRLEAGQDTAYLTLGDPTVYSTYIYIQRIVKEKGYEAQIISGVPSFCAIAARLGDSLADRSQQIHILPSSYDIEEGLGYKGTRILMKAGSRLAQVKEILKDKEMAAVMVENCGMEGEHIYRTVEEMPEKASYYSTVLVKDGKGAVWAADGVSEK